MTVARRVDAIVVGSGITGGWAAKELTERGLTVLMIERGSNIEHIRDYTREHRAPWELPFRGLGDRKRYERDYASARQSSSFVEGNEHFWAKDSEQPYASDPERPFVWLRGGGLGGRSLLWGRQSYRWSDLDFEANAEDGHGIDWPIRYRDIASWYDHVESFIGVSGRAEGLPQLPDGVFQPPMEFNCVEHLAKERIEAAFDDRILTIGRVAVLTRELHGRAPCHYCGPCYHGCSTGSYFSTQSSTLPAARATGRLTLRTDTIVEKIDYDPRTRRATGVRVVDATTGERGSFQARVVFLCASTLASTRILLNSRPEAFPKGLGNSSGVVGHYLMDHTLGMSGVGLVFGFEDRDTLGNRPNSFYIPRFRNLRGPRSDFVRGYGYQGYASRLGWTRGLSAPGFGKELKESLRKPGPWRLMLIGLGECLPRYENSATLDPKRVDRWGIPQLAISFSHAENERRMQVDAAEQAAAMLELCGARHIRTSAELSVGGHAIHEMGTARMGSDPRTSALNDYNQCHDVPNLFVTDGSCMTSSACQNPSLTYMALTARASAHAVEEMQRGAI
ncbi:MAG: GMC family oxidoreductase [Deltaproteobacteria bacterium]|nr:GMC family oxidoreductase [Deltaproteobacteria bacterium]